MQIVRVGRMVRARLWLGVLMALAALLLVLLFIGPCAFGVPSHEDRPEVGTLLHVWYGFDPATGESVGGRGSSHWDETVVVEPTHGYYASDDRDVIVWQVEQMRRAGISWVMVSWWGTGDTDFDGVVDQPVFAANHRATLAILDYLKTDGHGMKATVLVEPWVSPGADFMPLAGLTDGQRRLTWQTIRGELYESYKDVWFVWNGEPLVTAYMLMDIGPDQGFTYRRLAAAKWPWPDAFPMDWNVYDTQDRDEFLRGVSDDGFRKVSPRLNTEFLVGVGERDKVIQIDPRFDDDWLGQQVAWVQRDTGIRLVLAWTWNEYHEQNFFEPTTTLPPVGSGDYAVTRLARLRGGG